jgi:hypothetical protein
MMRAACAIELQVKELKKERELQRKSKRREISQGLLQL